MATSHDATPVVSDGEHDGFLTQDTAYEAAQESKILEEKGTKWTIGWYTPTLIVISYIVAFGAALGHYFFFRYLDGKAESETIAQTYVNWISSAFTRIFSVSLGAALGATYTQILWRLLREKSLSLSVIDNLFSLDSDPLQLRHRSVFLKAPLLWTFALFLPIVPMLTLLPTGANIVVSRPDPKTSTMSVPTTVLDYPSSNSYAALDQNALFQLDSISSFSYRCPTPQVVGMAKSVLYGGKYLTFPSPCGSNCSYTIQIPGPTFECESNITSNLYSLTTAAYGTQDQGYSLIGQNGVAGTSSTFNQAKAVFLAAVNKTRTAATGKYVFEMQWAPNFQASDSSPTMSSSLSCTAWYADYTFDIAYNNGIQNVTSTMIKRHVLNSTDVAYKLPFNTQAAVISGTPTTTRSASVSTTSSSVRYVGPGSTSTSGTQTSTSASAMPTSAFPNIYLSTNVYTILDAFITAMSGGLSAFGTTTQTIINTNILQTPFAQYTAGLLDSSSSLAIVDPTQVHLNINQDMVNSALQNITMSILSLPNANISTAVLNNAYAVYYSFEYPVRLWAPYGAALGVSIIFIGLGFVALLKNGVSATTGGFLQILVTTRGSAVVDQLARGSSIGGEENISEELMECKVMYGEMNDSKENGALIAGFGVPGEVVPLVKGRNYRS